MLKVITID